MAKMLSVYIYSRPSTLFILLLNFDLLESYFKPSTLFKVDFLNIHLTYDYLQFIYGFKSNFQ